MTRILALALVAAAAMAASASATSIRDDRIRHGAGVGPVQLGMSYA